MNNWYPSLYPADLDKLNLDNVKFVLEQVQIRQNHLHLLVAQARNRLAWLGAGQITMIVAMIGLFKSIPLWQLFLWLAPLLIGLIVVVILGLYPQNSSLLGRSLPCYFDDNNPSNSIILDSTKNLILGEAISINHLLPPLEQAVQNYAKIYQQVMSIMFISFIIVGVLMICQYFLH